MKDLRTLGLVKLNELFNTIPDFDYQPFIEQLFVAAIWPKVYKFDLKHLQDNDSIYISIQQDIQI